VPHRKDNLHVTLLRSAPKPQAQNRRRRVLDANDDAELPIVAASGLLPNIASEHANGRMNMRSSNARYSAMPDVSVG
jgi:hypothetical protein